MSRSRPSLGNHVRSDEEDKNQWNADTLAPLQDDISFSRLVIFRRSIVSQIVDTAASMEL